MCAHNQLQCVSGCVCARVPPPRNDRLTDVVQASIARNPAFKKPFLLGKPLAAKNSTRRPRASFNAGVATRQLIAGLPGPPLCLCSLILIARPREKRSGKEKKKNRNGDNRLHRGLGDSWEARVRGARGGGEEAGNECLSVAAEGQASGQRDSSRARTAKWPTGDRRGDGGGIAEDVLGGKQREEYVLWRATCSVDSHDGSLCANANLSMCINMIVIIGFAKAVITHCHFYVAGYL